MKNLKNVLSRALCLSLMILGCTQLSAQERVRVRGEVLDAESGKGVPYATVSLLDADSVLLTAWAADGNGKFDHAVNLNGSYIISADAIGYNPARKSVELAAPAADAGTLSLSTGVTIEGVVVSAFRPLVTADIDKVTYNVEADPEAPVNTLLDMLRKVPLVAVDAEDNVTLQGQSNFKWLMNGRNSSLMDRDARSVLRSMPASSVKNIEVITNPSSRYEAEGIGGIINIVTARRNVGGYNGSLSLMGDSFGSTQLVGYLNATTGKFNIGGYVGGVLQRRPETRYERFQENFLSDEYRYEHTESRSDQDLGGVLYNVQASYDIDSLNLLSLTLSGQHIGADLPRWGSTLMEDIDGNPTREFANTETRDVSVGYISANLDYQRMYMKPGKILTASYLLGVENQPSESVTRIDGRLDYPSYAQRLKDRSRFNEHTLQIDYVDPLTEHHSIETGAKLILRRNGNDPETFYRDAESDPWALDPSRRNALDYDQYILGVYGAYTYKLQKFSAKVGARLESTWNDGTFHTETATTRFDNNQLNLVPYATLSYAPSTTKRYSLSYTQRLSRPGIWYLNPYINDADPMNIQYGNPDLDAEVGHTFNATFGLFGQKHTLNISAGATLVNNAIERINIADADGVTRQTYENIGRSQRSNLSVNYSWRPSGKFTLSVNASGSYTDLRASNGIRNSGFAGNGNLQGRIALWKGGFATVNANYNTPTVTLQGAGMTTYNYGFGFSQQAFNQKVTFTLSANMPFQKDLHYYTTTDDLSFYRKSETWVPMRSVRFGISWNFGKTQVRVKRANRSITNDDFKTGSAIPN